MTVARKDVFSVACGMKRPSIAAGDLSRSQVVSIVLLQKVPARGSPCRSRCRCPVRIARSFSSTRPSNLSPSDSEGEPRCGAATGPVRMRALAFERGELVASRCGQLHLPSLSSCCESLDVSASCGVGSSRRIECLRSYAQEGADAGEPRARSWNRFGPCGPQELI